MSKIKNDGLDQYGTEPFKQQQFGTAGVEGVNEGYCYYSDTNICTTAFRSNADHPRTGHTDSTDTLFATVTLTLIRSP